MDKFLNYLGIVRRANNLVFGEKLFKKISQHQVYYVIISVDMGPAQAEKLVNKLLFYKIPYLIYFSSNVLNKAIGKNNIKAVGVTSFLMAKNLLILKDEFLNN